MTPAIHQADLVAFVRESIAADPAGQLRPLPGWSPENLAQAREAWPLHVAAYLANVELGLSTTKAGRLIGRTGTLVRYAVRRIEERRDEEPALDAFLDRLAAALRGETIEEAA